MIDIFDLEQYQKNFLSLVDKRGEVQPFKPNGYQQKLNDISRSKDKPLRILVLKARQIGCSTWASSYIYHKTATQFNKSSLIIADSVENSTGLFNMCKGYFDRSPDQIKPKQRYSNQKALVFADPTDDSGLNSQILVTTARNLAAGRSKTIQYLHCSEMAFWEDAATVTTGLFQSIPYVNNTGIIIESTANGISGRGEQFYKMCMRALDGDSAWSFAFFDWKDNPEYEIQPPPDFKLTLEEKELVAKYPSLTPPKVYFRRYKIENEMGSAFLDPRDQFKQEYPNEPLEAFVASGRPVFDAEVVHRHIARTNRIEFTRGRMTSSGFVEDDYGPIKVYKRPKDGAAYAIGADVAEGLVDGDYSTVCIVDREMNHVLSYCGHISPDQFGDLLVKLAKWYNGAVLAPEINNHGHAALAEIKRQGYHKLYKREVREELGADIQDKVGWLTNSKTKMLMLDEFVAAFRDGSFLPNDPDTLREMLSLNTEDNGNIVLNSKDRTVACCIALQAIKQAVLNGEYKASVPTRPVKRDVTKMTLQEKLKYYERRSR